LNAENKTGLANLVTAIINKGKIVKNETTGKDEEIISANLFANCTTLKNITIPPSIASIGQDAFKECGDLNVYIDNIEHWCGIVFGGGGSNPLDYLNKKSKTKGSKLIINNSLVTKIDKPNVTKIANKAFLGYSKLDSIILDVNTIEVGQHAFCRNTSLKNVSLLSESIDISTEAFGDCSSLQTVIVKSKNPDFNKGNSDGVGFTFRNVATIREIEAPISIINSIVSNNSGLRKVIINYATEIPNGIFGTCPSIEEIIIPFLGRTNQ
jgi:hypothetical protein